MKNIFCRFISTLLLAYIPSVLSKNTRTQRRTADTCGDPSTALTYYEAYNPSFQVHGLNTRTQFIVLNAVDNQDWHIMAPSFKAWAMPGQPGTFPLFGLFDQTLTDFLYVVATDGSTPQVTGYANKGIIAYVYPTQVCGSVPLYGASLPSTSNSDHWYTTDLAEKNLLVNVSGWADTGILAYVLPLNDCTCSS